VLFYTQAYPTVREPDVALTPDIPTKNNPLVIICLKVGGNTGLTTFSKIVLKASINHWLLDAWVTPLHPWLMGHSSLV